MNSVYSSGTKHKGQKGIYKAFNTTNLLELVVLLGTVYEMSLTELSLHENIKREVFIRMNKKD